MKHKRPIKSGNRITVYITDKETRRNEKESVSLYPKGTVDMEKMEEKKIKPRPTENLCNDSAATVQS